MNFLNKLIVPEGLRNEISHELTWQIEAVGVPEKVIGFEYVFEESLHLDGDYLILGSRKHSDEQKLMVHLVSGEVFHLWNFDKPEPVFLGSSLIKLSFSVFSNEVVLLSLIKSSALGAYSYNCEKYANFLRKVLNEIDPKCTENGAWVGYLEERANGIF